MYSSKESERNIARRFATLLFLLLPLANPASAETKGASAARDVATITGSTSGTHTILKRFNERVVLTSVDHIPIAIQLLFSSANTTQTLKPGRHKVHVHYTQGDWGSQASLWLDAEAGKAYVVRAHGDDKGVQFRIEEKATGRVVGGVDPGDDFKDELPPEPGSKPASSMTPSAPDTTSPEAGAPVAASPSVSNP
jgi:hypothetical protein